MLFSSSVSLTLHASIQRDNSIKELQAKIQSLESTLAKHLKSQNKVVVVEAADNRSLIDPAAWATSSDKGSSHPRVADEDMPVRTYLAY